MRLGLIGLECDRTTQHVDRLRVTLLVGQQHTKLEQGFGELWIEGHRAFEQRFDAREIRRRRFRLSAPQDHRVMKMGERVPRLRFHETGEALGDVGAKRNDAVHLAEKLIRPRICRIQIGSTAKRLHGIFVLSSCVLHDPVADIEPRRLRMPLQRRGKYLLRGIEGVQLDQVVAPVEQV